MAGYCGADFNKITTIINLGKGEKVYDRRSLYGQNEVKSTVDPWNIREFRGHLTYLFLSLARASKVSPDYTSHSIYHALSYPLLKKKFYFFQQSRM